MGRLVLSNHWMVLSCMEGTSEGILFTGTRNWIVMVSCCWTPLRSILYPGFTRACSINGVEYPVGQEHVSLDTMQGQQG